MEIFQKTLPVVTLGTVFNVKFIHKIFRECGLTFPRSILLNLAISLYKGFRLCNWWQLEFSLRSNLALRGLYLLLVQVPDFAYPERFHHYESIFVVVEAVLFQHTF